MNQSCNKLRNLLIIVIVLTAMILGIPSRASAYIIKKIEENTKHINYIDVAVDSDGNLYTFDANKHTVKMDPDGNILYDFGGLYDPRLLTVDPSGNVIIITTNENNNDFGDVVKFSKTATGYSFAWQKTMCVDVYPGLKELTTDSNGNFYLVFDKCVRKYDPSFNYITYISSTYSNGYINGVAVVDNVIYYTDGYNRKIMKIDAHGTHTIVKVLPFEGDLTTLDGSGNIYVTQTRESDCYIYKIDAGGNLSFYAGVMEKYDMGITGLAADRNGNVYAGYQINYDNSAVVRVIPSPEVSGISIGSGPASGGTAVTITGTGFSGAAEVRFGTNAAPSFSVVNDTTITVTSPPGSGAVSITVKTPARGTSNPSSAQFYYIPVVSGISPTSGPATGGTSVDITGTGFTSVTGVKFGGNTASYIFVSDTKVTATAPAGSGVADITITTAGGTSQTGPGDRFNYIPVVSGISPASGPIVGGATTIITGKGLTGTTAVKFGSASATILSVTDTSLTVTVPPGSGVVDVTVTTPGGTSVTSTAGRFSYLPVVNSISPNYGPLDGGTQVTISGSGFTGASAVNFGAKPAVSFTIVSDTQITATAPAGSGWVDVTVTTAGCASATGAGDRFYYPPAVSSLSLHEGPAQGGTSITITGTGFINVTGVSFGNITAKNYSVNSDTKITATAPKWGGVVHVYVTTVGGTSPATDNDLYTFIPAVSSVSQYEGGQGTGPATGGTKVAINGYGIGVIRDDASGQKITVAATAVYFGAIPATNVAVDTLYAGFINVNAPPGCGVVDVTVVTAYGTTAVNTNAKYKYIPIVNSISATNGPAMGGTEITINGAGFTSDTTVRFGATAAANVTYISDKQIKAISPPGNGKVDITVTTPGGTSATGTYDQFSYIPVISSISPASGPTTGGTTVIISGAGFTGATAVKFGTTSATSYTINSNTQITATTPAGFGKVDVTVTTAIGTSATNTNDQFGFIPVVSSISPAISQETGGVSVIIIGTGFTGATEVRFGTKAATNFTVNGDNSITATAPPGSGTVHITVITPGGTSVTGSSDQFTYDSQAPAVTIDSTVYSITNISPIPVQITFSEAVTGFDIGDITVSNGTKSNFSGSGTTYTLDVIPSAQGTVTVSVAAGVAQDAAGNGNNAGTVLSLTYDNQGPAITTGNLGLSNGYLDITFNEGIYTTNGTTALSKNDLALIFTANSGTATGATISNVTKTDGTSLRGGESIIRVVLNISGTPSGVETIEIKPAPGVTIYDMAGNGTTSLTTGAIHLNDKLAPILNGVAWTDNTHLTVTLSENCPNLTKSNNGGFTVFETGTPGIVYPVAAITRIDDSNVSLTVLNMGISAKEGVSVKYTSGGNGTIQDTAGNAMVTNNTGVTVAAWDTIGPAISLGTLADSNQYIDVTFSEGVYNSSNGSGAVLASQLQIWDQNGGIATIAAISSLKKPNSEIESSAAFLTGGEQTIRVFLKINSNPGGSDKIEIKTANGAQVYDLAGNPASASTTTGLISLHPVILTLTADQVLTETTLATTNIRASLTGTSLTDRNLTGKVSLLGTTGLIISSVTYVDPTHCTLRLTGALNGDVNLGIKIDGTAIASGYELASDTIKITDDLPQGKTTIIIGTGNGDGSAGTSDNHWYTAESYQNSYRTVWNGGTLHLGKGIGGSPAGLWLYDPGLISGIPNNAQVDRSELILKIKSISGDKVRPRKIKIYQVTDNSKGMPCFRYDSSEGIRTGLDFYYRDHRLGRNIPWSDSGKGDITTICNDSSNLLDSFEFVPQAFAEGAYDSIRLDVSEAVKAWLKNNNPNQGLYITVDGASWEAGEQVEFYGSTSANAADRPQLKLTYLDSTTAGGTAPGRISAVTITQLLNQRVDLSWTGASGAAGYRVVRKYGVTPANPGDGTLVYDEPVSKGTSVSDTSGLANGKIYYYAVFVYNANSSITHYYYGGKAYAQAIPGNYNGIPNAPGDLTVTVSGRNVSLSWTDKSDNEKGFKITRIATATKVFTVKENQTNYVDRELTAGNYTYQVLAYNDAGESSYILKNISVTDLPAAPKDLKWNVISSSEVQLSWTNDTTVTYRVEIVDDQGNVRKEYPTAANLSGGTYLYPVMRLTANVGYRFRIVAINAAGGENASETDVVKTSPDPKPIFF